MTIPKARRARVRQDALPAILDQGAIDDERMTLFRVLQDALAEPVTEGCDTADPLLRRICQGLVRNSRMIRLACYLIVDEERAILTPEFAAGMEAGLLRVPLPLAGPLREALRDRRPSLHVLDDPGTPMWLQALHTLAAEVVLFPFGVATIRGVGVVGVAESGFLSRIGLDYFAAFTNLGNLALSLRAQALHDALTGLPNRGLYMDRLAHARAAARRRRRLLGVALLDLDGFKQINDRYGHGAGDFVLTRLGQVMREAMRPADTLARIGGDEFALLFVDMPCLGDIEALCARLLDALRSTWLSLDAARDVSLTGSLGLTVYPLDDGDPETLMRHADLALYAAKAGGRDQSHIHSLDLDRAIDADFRTSEVVRRALAEGRMCLYYQPIATIDGSVVGFEALLRLVREDGTVLRPESFGGALDAAGLARPIGRFVLEAVACQMEAWVRAGFELADRRPVHCSINISAAHLLNPAFLDDLRTVLSSHPLVDPAAFEIEITESAPLRDLEGVHRTLTACQDLHIRTALDDFGTGYASLTHLQRLPVDTIKIDQSFVRDMADDPKDHAIVSAITHVADRLGLNVIAEGVETAAHIRMLKALGCACVQGYALARAMPAATVPRWARRYAQRQCLRPRRSVVTRADKGRNSREG